MILLRLKLYVHTIQQHLKKWHKIWPKNKALKTKISKVQDKEKQQILTYK